MAKKKQSDWIQLTKSTAGTHCVRLEAGMILKKHPKKIIKINYNDFELILVSDAYLQKSLS